MSDFGQPSRRAEAEQLRAARRRVRAAGALLERRDVDPRDAAPLLLEGWNALRRAATRAADDRLRAWGAGLIEESSDRLKRAIDEGAEPDDDGWRSERDRLRAAIRRFARSRRSVRGGPLLRVVRLVVWSIAAAAVFALLAVVAWGGTQIVSDPEPGEGLTATYYQRPGFGGHPFVRVDPELDFEWRELPPVLGLRRKGFSVAWEGCLAVEQGERLRLVAYASGAPLAVAVDGRPAIALPKSPEGVRGEAGDVLEPGVHRLRVECARAGLPMELELGWKADGAGEEIIPWDRLISLGGSARFDCPIESGEGE
ncbi:MAG: hypothetical protein R6V85_06655 [Polyangia bacterium]